MGNLPKITVLFTIGILLNCEGSQNRQFGAGGANKLSAAKPQDADAGSATPDNDQVIDGAVSTGESSSGDGVAQGKSLEQCTAEKKAWIAVVASGAEPAECGSDLVAWCCTKEEIYQRFPTAAATLREEFEKYETDEGVKLYHCSRDSANKTTFHMATIRGAKTFYRYLFVDKLFEVEPSTAISDCPQITTDDLTE